MKNLFSEILDIEGVEGILLLDSNGKVIFKHLKSQAMEKLGGLNGQTLVNTFHEIQEAELVFEYYRIYLRKTDSGFILVAMNGFAKVAMVRINCNVLLPALAEKIKKPRGISRFFRKR